MIGFESSYISFAVKSIQVFSMTYTAPHPNTRRSACSLPLTASRVIAWSNGILVPNLVVDTPSSELPSSLVSQHLSPFILCFFLSVMKGGGLIAVVPFIDPLIPSFEY